MNSSKIFNLFVVLIILFFSIISFFIIQDYGIGIDQHQHLGIGHKYLYYFKTGHLDFKDQLPIIDNFPHIHSNVVADYPYNFLPFINIISAVNYHLFHKTFKILDIIAAHNITTPIFIILLLFFLFFFVKKYWNPWSGILSVLILITNPRFFGHIFYNVTGITEIVFFSITIMLFADWIMQYKIKYLYWSFFFWGLALATRIDAMLIPPIVILWQLPYLLKDLIKDVSIKLRTLFHIMIGFCIPVIIMFICLPPLHPWIYNTKKEFILKSFNFIVHMYRFAIGIGIDITSTWNLYAPSQIFYTTPIITLLFFLIGLAYLFKKINKVNLLLIVWTLFPVIRHCFPNVNHYDGLRHFFVFIVPFSIIASLGTIYITKLIVKKIHIKKYIIFIIFSSILILPNLYHLIALHPFQTTFYNCLIGGLKGAQKKDFPFSSDYLLNSIRTIINWINKNAKQDAKITFPIFRYYDSSILEPYILRKDLKIINFDTKSVPKNTYIIDIPRRWNRLDWGKLHKLNAVFPEIEKLPKVLEIKRQGGNICTIYYKEK